MYVQQWLKLCRPFHYLDWTQCGVSGNTISQTMVSSGKTWHCTPPIYLPFSSSDLLLSVLSNASKSPNMTSCLTQDSQVKEKKSYAFSHNKTRKFNSFHYIKQSHILTSGGSSASTRLSKVKQLIQLADDTHSLEHSRLCVQQESTLCLPQSESDDLWSETVMLLSECSHLPQCSSRHLTSYI